MLAWFGSLGGWITLVEMRAARRRAAWDAHVDRALAVTTRPVRGAAMTDYYQLSDAEWEWVACFLEDRNAPSAYALRGYLNDRITERLVTARADERERLARQAATVTVTRGDDGGLTFTADDPNGVGWVPVDLALIPQMAAQSRALFDLRNRVLVLWDHAHEQQQARGVPSPWTAYVDAYDHVLRLFDGDSQLPAEVDSQVADGGSR
jgi:hypothetical protein